MDEESTAQAQRWAEDVSAQVIDWTWRGFDQLRDEHLSQVDFNQPLEQVERDLTSKHFMCINQLWAMETGGFSSISPHHEYPENETRPPAPGQATRLRFGVRLDRKPESSVAYRSESCANAKGNRGLRWRCGEIPELHCGSAHRSRWLDRLFVGRRTSRVL
jgi:hypothetical protein